MSIVTLVLVLLVVVLVFMITDRFKMPTAMRTVVMVITILIALLYLFPGALGGLRVHR